jgi:hypothetical protein
MKMRVRILISLIGLLLFLPSGCSIGPAVYMTADGINHREPSGVRLMPSGNRADLFAGSLKDYMSQDFTWQADNRMDQNEVCRIKYHKQYYKNRYIVVEGRIGRRGNRYPVVLDTGASQPIFLNMTHVLDNKLPIYCMEETDFDLNGYKLGLCELPLLEIGDITFTNRPCLYLESPDTVKLFGVYIADRSANSNTVIVGLPVLREFKYVMFDNIHHQAEFSYNQSFEAGQEETWEKYPISIEEDFHGNEFLYVRIPIAGEQIELQFDTGSGRGLAIGEGLWEQIASGIPDLNLSRGKDFYPYIGRLSCRKGVVPNLQVGDRMITNAGVSVFPDDSLLLAESEGLLGMQYFQKTVVVLDFEKSLMWIRNQGM